jgi:gamma-glutamyltranspeptidase / glutathione hydrolase
MARFRFLAAAACVLLCGCSWDVGKVDTSLGFGPETPRMSAFVVGDEPYAVRAAATVMGKGGNAVDAVSAMYFALSVTYPAAAGLGGGGICLVHDPKSGRNEEFDFLARDASGGGAYAVPGNVRGFALMQTAYGALPWSRVIAPSEGYAATGFVVSKALAARLKAAEDVIRLDAGLAAEFMDESGHAKTEGVVVSNRDLADTLSAIRTEGADALYAGAIADRITGYSAAQGGAIVAAELANYPAERNTPQGVRFAAQSVFLPSERTGAGAFAGTLFDNLGRAEATKTGATNTEAAIVAATRLTLSKYDVSGLPNDLGATGFAATDNNGQAAACAVTMNGPFGSGHTAPNTGVTLSKAPSADKSGLAAAFLTPVIALDEGGRVVLAGAGAGGPVGSASIADALARLGKGEIVAKRSGEASPNVNDTVNAIVCQQSVCTALPDSTASGLAAAPF